jgi:hypothetical protein
MAPTCWRCCVSPAVRPPARPCRSLAGKAQQQQQRPPEADAAENSTPERDVKDAQRPRAAGQGGGAAASASDDADADDVEDPAAAAGLTFQRFARGGKAPRPGGDKLPASRSTKLAGGRARPPQRAAAAVANKRARAKLEEEEEEEDDDDDSDSQEGGRASGGDR